MYEISAGKPENLLGCLHDPPSTALHGIAGLNPQRILGVELLAPHEDATATESSGPRRRRRQAPTLSKVRAPIDKQDRGRS